LSPKATLGDNGVSVAIGDNAVSVVIGDNAVSVAIGDNGNRLISEIWWNFFYDLFSIKNVADVLK
jgi:hypothetical protein